MSGSLGVVGMRSGDVSGGSLSGDGLNLPSSGWFNGSCGCEDDAVWWYTLLVF